MGYFITDFRRDTVPNGRWQVTSSGRKEKTAYRGVSGLVSGHRYYSPVLGRWPSRDPIGYLGGCHNLQCFILNNPVSLFDLLGLSDDVTRTTYDVKGPYYQLGVKLGSGEWGEANAEFDADLLDGGKYDISEIGDENCKDCIGWDVTREQKVKYYAKNLRIKLPKWVDYSSASADEKKAWDTMIAGLTVHENGHIANYKSFNATILIKGFGSACDKNEAITAADDDFMNEVDAEYDKRYKRVKSLDEKYDEETSKGTTQGAVLIQV